MYCWLLLTFCVAGMTSADTQVYNVEYDGGADGITAMKVKVDLDAGSVRYHMAEAGNFEDVDTLELYNLGLAASRVPVQEACYVRRLVKTLEDQVTFLKAHQGVPMKLEHDVKVSAVALDNLPEEEIGAELAAFCGDLTVYKLVKDDGKETSVAEGTSAERRQVTVTFTRCVLILLIPVCYSTSLTIPTGSTITYTWFWFG